MLIDKTVVTERKAEVPTVPDGTGTNVPLERGNGGRLCDVDEATLPVLLLLATPGAEVAFAVANGGNVTVVDAAIGWLLATVPLMTDAEVALDMGNGAKLADTDDGTTPAVPVPVGPGTPVEFDSGNGTITVDVDEDTKLAVTVMVASGPELVLEKGNGRGGAAEKVLRAMVPVPVPATPGTTVEFETGIGMMGENVLRTPVPLMIPVAVAGTIGVVEEFDSGKGAEEKLPCSLLEGGPPVVVRITVDIAGGVFARLPVRSVVEPFRIDVLSEKEVFGVANEPIDGVVRTSGLVTLVIGNGTVTVVDGTMVVVYDVVMLDNGIPKGLLVNELCNVKLEKTLPLRAPVPAV